MSPSAPLPAGPVSSRDATRTLRAPRALRTRSRNRPGAREATLCRMLLADTPVGPLTLIASAAGLREVRFESASGERHSGATHPPRVDPRGASRDRPQAFGNGHSPIPPCSAPILEVAADAVHAYLDGAPDAFGVVPLDLTGSTDFQHAVYRLLAETPRGSLVTYGEIAERLGRGSPRAVGQAVGSNPLPVVIPCHRVVARNRRLGGFSGGLDRKVALLELEGILTRGDGPRATIAAG